MRINSALLDDLSKNDPVRLDFAFFEQNFAGVRPFEMELKPAGGRSVYDLAVLRETEKLARGAKPERAGGPRRASEPASAPDADIAALERQLSDLLGLNVRIAHSEKGGTLTLTYGTLDQLDMVCQRLTGDTI